MGMQRSRLKMAATVVVVGAMTAAVAGCGSSSKSGAPTTTAPSGPKPVTITAGDYKFEGLPKTLTAGVQTITVVNKVAVEHEMTFLKVKSGTTKEQLFPAIEKVFEGKPFAALLEAINGVANTAAGKTTVTQLNLPAGDYFALCGDTGT